MTGDLIRKGHLEIDKEEGPCKDTGKKSHVQDEERGSQKKPTLLIPSTWTF